MKILIAEDDQYMSEGFVEMLEPEGYDVIVAQDGASALELIESEHPQLICLDIMMPKVNGYDVCRKIRANGSQIPVIFISAKTEEIDKVLGLELGADDYITKPFGVREVLARIRAVTRRYLTSTTSKEETGKVFSFGPWQIVPHEMHAKSSTHTVEISLRDIRILHLLHAHCGQVVSRKKLFEKCWALDFIPDSRTLDQHISQLRKKIEVHPKEPKLIQTVHGAGYRYPRHNTPKN